MVAVDFDITRERKVEIEHAVFDDVPEHVLKERDRVFAAHAGLPVEVQGQRNARLIRFAVNLCGARHG